MCVLDIRANRFAILPDNYYYSKKGNPGPNISDSFFVLYRSNILMLRYATLKCILPQLFFFFFPVTYSTVFI